MALGAGGGEVTCPGDPGEASQGPFLTPPWAAAWSGGCTQHCSLRPASKGSQRNDTSWEKPASLLHLWQKGVDRISASLHPSATGCNCCGESSYIQSARTGASGKLPLPAYLVLMLIINVLCFSICTAHMIIEQAMGCRLHSYHN